MPQSSLKRLKITPVKDSGSTLIEYLLITVLFSVGTLVAQNNLAKHTEETLVASATILSEGGGTERGDRDLDTGAELPDGAAMTTANGVF